MKSILSKLIILLLLSSFLIPLMGSAQIISIQNPLNATSFEGLVNNLTNFIFYVALALTPLMIIIAGVQYVTAGGDPKKIETAGKIILYTVIGLVIILLAKALIYVLREVLGG